MLAAEDKNLLALTRLLKAGADPNEVRLRVRVRDIQTPIRVTALTIAIKNNDTKCVEELIRAGCFFDCDRGLEALEMAKNERFMAAVAEGEKAMQKYLKHNLDQRGTAFYVAFTNERIDLLQDLIDAGVSFNLKSLTFEDEAKKEALITMLTLSALNNLRGKVGNLETLLTQAVQLQDISIVKILIEKYSDLDIVNFCKNKTLQVACSGESVELINALLIGAKMEAVSCSHIEIVELLVSSGADVNCIDEDGSTLLIKAVQSKQMEIVNFLIEKKVNIDQADDSQSTALHYACRSNNLEIVKLLVNAGAKFEGYNNESYTLFSDACKVSNIDMMKLLIYAGSNINCVDKYQRTPLINSIKDHSIILKNSIIERNFATTQFLLEHGADISMVDIDGMTALMWAAKTNNEQVFDLLLDLKPEVNCVDLKQMTALAYAVMNSNVQMVAKLIQAGADVNITFSHRVKCYNICMCGTEENVICESLCTPTIVAVLSSDSELLHLLIQHGAILDMGKYFELMIALEHRNVEMSIALLKYGADANMRDTKKTPTLTIAIKQAIGGYIFHTPLVSSKSHYGIQNWRDKIKLVAESFLNNGANVSTTDNEGNTCLHAAAELGDVDVLELFVAHKADVNVQNAKGETPFMMACRHCGNVEAVRYLLTVGADVMLVDENKNTTLHHTMLKGDELLCRYEKVILELLPITIKHLIENNANIHASNGQSNTNLHLAAKFDLDASISALIKHGVNVNYQNNEGNTPLFLMKKHKLINYLIDFGSDINLQNKLGETLLHHAFSVDVARVLLEMGADKEIRTNKGQSALMYAAEASKYSLAQLLVEHGASVNVQDNKGKNALMIAIENYAIKRMSDRKKNTEFLNILLEHGADVNASDATGQTACMIAANKDCTDYCFEVLPKLLAYGADINKVDSKNRTALVHILLKIDTNKLYCISNILKLGADLVVDNEYRYLVKKISKKIEKHKEYGRTTSEVSRRLFQFCLVNGCISSVRRGGAGGAAAPPRAIFSKVASFWKLFKLKVLNIDIC
ncbi:serine/threonine-protein phosphatase 6 regulatory ankyrin repeat subunit A-like [Physella acuta]|uniref:serine/threonine-protein phosphatase 6 regulatory ankyrin repeat subunit A-like n=1 Tax=Physella acuta TaxID=109671 RepID=UPI0027DCB251|nr:serine/threonine-protein phosphatase 6 regulatory ankyrin repeat subunit A-like [Physella acuta]